VEKLNPPLVGWRSTPVPYNLDATAMSFAVGAKKFEYSTMSYASAIGLAESMQYLRKIGRASVTKHVLSLTRTLVDAIGNDQNLFPARILTPDDEGSHASIVSFRFKNRDQSTIAAGVVQRNVIVSQRFNGVRFSFHIFNTEQDLLRATQALGELLAK